MAEEQKQEVEVKDRGLFDFMGKKEEGEKKNEEEVLVAGVEKVHIEEVKKEEKEEEKKESLFDKLHRSHSFSSSSVSLTFLTFPFPSHFSLLHHILSFYAVISSTLRSFSCLTLDLG